MIVRIDVDRLIKEATSHVPHTDCLQIAAHGLVGAAGEATDMKRAVHQAVGEVCRILDQSG